MLIEPRIQILAKSCHVMSEGHRVILEKDTPSRSICYIKKNPFPTFHALVTICNHFLIFSRNRLNYNESLLFGALLESWSLSDHGILPMQQETRIQRISSFP